MTDLFETRLYLGVFFMQINRLLFPFKGTAIDQQAVSLAASLVKAEGGHVYALYVIEVSREHPVDADLPDEIARGEIALRKVEELLKEYKCDVTAEFLQARDAGPAVIKESLERQADLILLGMPYSRRFGIFSMGHAVPYILENASCSVLVLREPMTAEPIAAVSQGSSGSSAKLP